MTQERAEGWSVRPVIGDKWLFVAWYGANSEVGNRDSRELAQKAASEALESLRAKRRAA